MDKKFFEQLSAAKDEQLVEASQLLGPEQDAIREKRRLIADELRRRHPPKKVVIPEEDTDDGS
jgi:hypothetical protein